MWVAALSGTEVRLLESRLHGCARCSNAVVTPYVPEIFTQNPQLYANSPCNCCSCIHNPLFRLFC
jgi:hypothetical protein